MQSCTQAIILAAGKGTRMKELVLDRPKPMLQVQGKNLIEWKLEVLPESVSEVIIVVGYLGNIIKEYFGNEWKGRKITYVEQVDLNGTGGALMQCRPLLRGRFFVMMGDDLYGKEDIDAILTHPLAIAVKKRSGFSGGAVVVRDDHTLDYIKEGEHSAESYFNVGLYVLDTRIFDFPPQPAGNGHDNEIGLPQTIAVMARSIPVYCYPFGHYLQITAPEDITVAEKSWHL